MFESKEIELAGGAAAAATTACAASAPASLLPSEAVPGRDRPHILKMVSSGLLSKLSRVTSSGKYIAEIDGLRFIAIGAVVVFHLSGYLTAKSDLNYISPPETDWLAGLARHGHYGVQLFFVISGFVLALPFASHYLKGAPAVNLKQYFLRRLTRLEPPYLLSIAAFFCLLVLLHQWSAEELFPHLAAGSVYLHNLAYGRPNVINVVTWSLEIEVQFYLLVPLISLLFAVRDKVRRRSIIVFVNIVFSACQWLFFSDTLAELTVLNFVQFFLTGFMLADIYLVEWNENPAHGRRWDIVSLVGWPSLFIIWRWQAVSNFIFPFMILLLYYSVFRGVLINRVLSNRWITTVGGMCYSIYLLHYPLISFIGRYTKAITVTKYFSLHLLIQLVIVGSALLLVSAIYFAFVEKPCMRKDWPRRFWQLTRSALMQGA